MYRFPHLIRAIHGLLLDRVAKPSGIQFYKTVIREKQRMKKSNKALSYANAAYQKIKLMILTGEKPPNSRLIPADLEQELGIGRVPIREALIELGRTGLVQNIPYKGAVVGAPPTIEEMKEIFRLKISLEPMLSVFGLAKMDGTHLSELKKTHRKMCSPDVKPEDYFDLNRHFHFTIYEASGFLHLCSIAKKIYQSVDLFRSIYIFSDADLDKFNKEHETILNLIEKKDAEGLKREIVSNLESGRDIYLEAYERMKRFRVTR